MKQFLPFLILFLLASGGYAQYCGNSGAGQCTVSGTVTQPGLFPMYDSLPPFINNVSSTTVIQFRNFNVVFFQGIPFTLDSLRIDSIENLPTGLCWASDQTDNTYLNSENGCIKVNGIPCDSTGQYKLRIIATAYTGGGSLQVNAASVGLHYYVRLNNPPDTITPIDSVSTPFVPYGGLCEQLPPPTVEFDTTQIHCAQSTILLDPFISGGQPPLRYLWQSSGDTLSCDTCRNPTLHLTQHDTIIVTVTDYFNRSSSDTAFIFAAGAGGNFQITADGPTSFCTGDSVTLGAHTNFGFSINWKRDTTILTEYFNDTTLTITDTSGDYYAFFSGGGCTASSNIIPVSVNPTPSVSVTPTGPVSVCQGTSATLQSTATPGISYLWQLNGNNLNAATNATYSAAVGGTYRVVVKTPQNCTDTSNAVTVNVNPLPTVTLPPTSNPDTLCLNASPITLTGGSPAGGTYNGSGVSGTTFTPSTAGTGPITISYSYTDNNNCTNAATEIIVVRICTGIDETVADNMLVYPNPVKEVLYVQSPVLEESTASFDVVDISGKKIDCDYKLQNDKLIIKTNSLPEGVYLLKLRTGNGLELSRMFMKN